MKRLFQNYLNVYRGLPAPIWVLAFSIFINRSGGMVLTFMALYLTQILHVPIELVGKIIALYGVGSVLGTQLGGWMADRFGSIRIQVGTLAISGVCILIMQQLQEPWFIGGMLFLFGLTGDGYRPANNASVTLYAPENVRSRSYALNRLGINAGQAIGASLGGILAAVSYGLLFQVDAWTCIAAAAIVWIYFRKRRPLHQGHDADISVPTKFFQDRVLIHILLVLLLNTFCFMQCLSTFAVYVKEVYGLSEYKYGQLMALNCVIITFCEMAIVHYFQSRNYMRALAAGSLLSGIGYALLPHYSGFFWAALVITILTIGEMLSVPTLFSLIAKRAPKRQVGQYMALASGSFSVMWVVTPPVSTWIYARWGANTLWYVVGGVAILNAVLASRLKKV